MWQKDGEQQTKDCTAKFPVLTPPNSPFNVQGAEVGDHHSGDNFSGISHTESSLNSVNNNQSDYDSSNNNLNRFSRYDNLEVERAEDESSEDGHLEGEEKISAPWDSSKWEHLLRLVSESTQQLDSLQMLESSLDKTKNLNVLQNEGHVPQLTVPTGSLDPKQRVRHIIPIR